MFKDSLCREYLTNLGVKGTKRSVKICTTIFCKTSFKNILLYMNGRLSKIRSVHTHAIHRTVYFGWICITVNYMMIFWLYKNLLPLKDCFYIHISYDPYVKATYFDQSCHQKLKISQLKFADRQRKRKFASAERYDRSVTTAKKEICIELFCS